MRIITKFLLFSLVLLISLGTISATDNSTVLQDNLAQELTQQQDSNYIETSTQLIDNNVQTSEKTIEKNKDITQNNVTKKTAVTITVTDDNYDEFFRHEEGKTYPESTEMIRKGDILNLKGSFYNKQFMVDKNITFTSLNKDAKLYNCTVYIMGEGASGSTVSNLDIFNEGTLIRGIQVKNASNLTVKDNHVVTYGLRSYGFVADYMNDSTIESNYFERDGDDWRYIAFVIGKSHHNTIRNNSVITGANGIYLSIYGSYEADFVGGACDYNLITGNKINARGYITSWCYTIQVMGAYNTVTYNTVTGGFRGISTQDYVSNYIAYNEVHAINEGIYACENATVIYNNVEVNESATGITIGSDNVFVTNNTIVAEGGYGINIDGNNALIVNNNITSTGNCGIYSKGQYHGIIIDNNRITSNKEGILFKKQTRTKKINDIYVNKNTIISDSDYAINFEEAGAFNAEDVNVTVTSSNVLTSAKGRGTIAYLPPSNTNSTTQLDSDQHINITAQNYNSWFTNSIANNEIQQNATVTLIGTFNNCNFTFNKKVHLIGQNCVINEGTITLTGDSHESTITNIKIVNNDKTVTRHGIALLEVNNFEITNVEIKNYADYESIGIFLYGSNGGTIKNNKITTSGDYVNDAILAYGSDANIIHNNSLNLNQSSLRLEYDDSIMFNEKIGSVTEVLHNHGIMLLYSSNNNIQKNNVKVTSQFKSYTFPENDCKNSVVGIDVYFDSHRNVINNNNINITSYGPFVYGIGVLGGQWGSSILTSNATANEYRNNTVNLEGGYYATGFIAGRNSIDTIVESNVFNVHVTKDNKRLGDYGHAIVLENSTTSYVYNNKINAEASSLYTIELYDSNNNNIVNNTITSRGTNPYGIAAYRAVNNTVILNNFSLNKENLGESTSAYHADTIDVGDEAIMFSSASSNNNISNNTIRTNTNTTVKLTEECTDNYVMYNSLVANNTVADESVLDLGTSNTVSNNFVYYVNATIDPVEIYVGDYVKLLAHINTTSTDNTNLTVTFKINNVVLGTNKVVNGKSNFTYTKTLLMTPGNLAIEAIVSGTNFQNKTAVSTLKIYKNPEKTTVTLNKVLAKVGTKAVLTAEVKTTNGYIVDSGKVAFYMDNVLLETVDLKLGSASCNYTVASNAPNIIHNITANYLGDKEYEKSSASNILGVQSISNINISNYTATLGDNVNIKLDVMSGSKKVDSGSVVVFINNINLAEAKITKGTVNTNIKIPTTFDKGTYNLIIVFEGNDTLSEAMNKSKITLKPMTPVLHYNTTWVDIGETASLQLVVDNGATGDDLCLADGGNVSVKLNGEYLKDSKGNIIYGVLNKGKLTFTFTAPSQLSGTQNITFDFGGNSKFSSASKTFTNALGIGKINTIVTLDKIATVAANNNVTLTGRFTDESGKAISNSNVRIFINGVKYLARTDKNGYYNLSVKVTTPGINNVTYGYGGNAKYNAYEKNTTFTVGKQNVIVTVDAIKEVPAGTNVTITGKFTDDAYKAIGNSVVHAYINGNKYIARTDKTGKYTFSVLVKNVGINNLTVGYGGNVKYNAYDVNKTFNVGKQNVIVTVDAIKVVPAGTNVTITGKFTNNLGNALSNSNVRLYVNGVKYYAKTDKYGKYTLSVLVTNVGINNLTAGYGGSAKYNEYNINTTFTVGKQDVIVTHNKISDVKVGKNVTITGKFTNNLGKAISNSNVKIVINGVKYFSRTDSTGTYTFTYQTTTTGINNVTVGYGGSAKYNAYETATTFKVTS